MKVEYVITEETNPYRNLATEQELMRHAEDGMAILFLWQNANTIVIGRNQNPRCECRIDEFLNAGGKIARRNSGGGAVYHDMGNLNFSIICKDSDQEFCRYQELVSNVLKEFRIDVEYNGRNDITAGGKKFSGNAVYKDGEAVCQHGTVLIATDIDKMTYYLTPEKSKLERNHIKSVSSRVVNLSSLDSGIDIKGMIQAFICSTKAMKLDYMPDKEIIERLTNFYKSDMWVYGGKDENTFHVKLCTRTNM